MFPAIRQVLYADLMPPFSVAVKNLPLKNLSDALALAVFFGAPKRQAELHKRITYRLNITNKKRSATTYGAITPPGNPIKKTITCLSESSKGDIPQTGAACFADHECTESKPKSLSLLKCPAYALSIKFSTICHHLSDLGTLEHGPCPNRRTD